MQSAFVGSAFFAGMMTCGWAVIDIDDTSEQPSGELRADMLMLHSNGTDSRQWQDSEASSCNARWAMRSGGGCGSTKGGGCGSLEKPLMASMAGTAPQKMDSLIVKVKRSAHLENKDEDDKGGCASTKGGVCGLLERPRKRAAPAERAMRHEAERVRREVMRTHSERVMRRVKGTYREIDNKTGGDTHMDWQDVTLNGSILGRTSDEQTASKPEQNGDAFQIDAFEARDIPMRPLEGLPDVSGHGPEEDLDYLPWTPAEKRFVEKNYLGVMRLSVAARYGPAVRLIWPAVWLIVLLMIGLPVLMAARLLRRLFS